MQINLRFTTCCHCAQSNCLTKSGKICKVPDISSPSISFTFYSGNRPRTHRQMSDHTACISIGLFSCSLVLIYLAILHTCSMFELEVSFCYVLLQYQIHQCNDPNPNLTYLMRYKQRVPLFRCFCCGSLLVPMRKSKQKLIHMVSLIYKTSCGEHHQPADP